MSVILYRRPADVAVVDDGGPESVESASARVVYVARLPKGPLIVLDGSAAVIWRAATMDGGPELTVYERVASSLGLAPETIRTDVENFLGELVDHGLLEPLA